MTSGYMLIKELGKHGLRGYYFSHKQYKELVRIKNFSQLKEKIIQWGYADVEPAKDISEIVHFLKKSHKMTESEKGCLTAMFLEPIFWLLLFAFSGC